MPNNHLKFTAMEKQQRELRIQFPTSKGLESFRIKSIEVSEDGYYSIESYNDVSIIDVILKEIEYVYLRVDKDNVLFTANFAVLIIHRT